MAPIMIVDDDPYIRELVRVFMLNEGFDVIEAEDGAEALKTAANRPSRYGHPRCDDAEYGRLGAVQGAEGAL